MLEGYPCLIKFHGENVMNFDQTTNYQYTSGNCHVNNQCKTSFLETTVYKSWRHLTMSKNSYRKILAGSVWMRVHKSLWQHIWVSGQPKVCVLTLIDTYWILFTFDVTIRLKSYCVAFLQNSCLTENSAKKLSTACHLAVNCNFIVPWIKNYTFVTIFSKYTMTVLL